MLRGSTRVTRRHLLVTVTGVTTTALFAACQAAPASPAAAPTTAATTAPTSVPTKAPAATQASAAAPTVAAKPAAQQRKQVTLEYWNWWDIQRTALMNEIIDGLQKEHPWIKVNNAVQTWDRRDERVLTALAGGNPPQVMMVTRVELVRFASEGLITPITKYVKARNIDVNSLFYPAEIATMWWKGELYSMPNPTAGGETSMVQTNKDIFAKAGLDPEKPPKTWAEVEQFGKSMTKKAATGAIEQMGADIGTSGAAWVGWLYANGGEYLNEDLSKVIFNGPEGVETLEWMVKYVKEVNGGIEATNDWFQAAGGQTAQHPWFLGKEGMWFPNVSTFFNTKKLGPNVKWGLGLKPYNSNNSKAASHGVSALSFGWGYTIPKKLDPDTEEAAYLLVEAITVKDGACKFMFEQMRPSPNKRCNENPKYKEINPYWEVVLKALESDIAMRVTPVQGQLYRFTNQALEQAMFGKAKPKEALDKAAAEAQRVLDDWRSKQK